MSPIKKAMSMKCTNCLMLMDYKNISSTLNSKSGGEIAPPLLIQKNRSL